AWDEHASALLPLKVSFAPNHVRAHIPADIVARAQHPVTSEALNISAGTVDFVNAVVALKNPAPDGVDPVVVLNWSSEREPAFDLNRHLIVKLKNTIAPQSISFCVSEHKCWLESEKIRQVRLTVPQGPFRMAVKSLDLSSGEAAIPRLDAGKHGNSAGQSMVENSIGVTWTGKLIGPLHYDVTKIPGATQAVYELSRRDCWFDHYSGKLVDDIQAPEVTQRGTLPQPAADNCEIVPAQVQQSGYYSLRIFAADRQGKPFGYSSYPLSLWIANGKDR
ncbi:MAG: hypothetical protein ACRD3W_13050, partial [Terriglobales bacterium]